MSRTRYRIPFLAALVVLLLEAACVAPPAAPSGGGAGGSSGGAGASVVVAQGVDANTLDPALAVGSPTLNIQANMFDSLVFLDRDLKIVPALAESWKTSEDGKTWTFKLRQGVKFHNGEEFNADSVKFTIDRVLDANLKSPYARQISFVDRVNVVDPSTVEIVTKTPSPTLPGVFAVWIKMVPPKYVKEAGDQQFGLKPVGTGAYKFVEWVKDDHVTMTANESYFGGAPKVQKVTFRSIPEPSTRLAELQGGNVDVIVSVPSQHVDPIKNSDKAAVKTVPSARYAFVQLRPDQKPLDNPKVRQALNYAVDKDSIIKNILEGYGHVSNGALPPYVPGNLKDQKPYPYDPDKAKQLLTEAGVGGGFSVDFETTSGRYPKDKEVSEAIAGQLAKVGVTAKVSVIDGGAVSEKLGKRANAPMFFLAWTQLPDADLHYGFLVDSKGFFSYYNNPQIDKQIQDARSILDPAKRTAQYEQIEKGLYDDPPRIFLYQQEDIYGVSKRLNWDPHSDERLYMRDASVK